MLEVENKTIIIQASNVNSGGGQVLLSLLLKDLASSNEKVLAFVDRRFVWTHQSSSNIQIELISPKLLSRLHAEYKVWRASRKFPSAAVLCFGNLPPLLPLPGKTFLFFQNNILLKRFSHFSFSFMTKCKHSIERAWLAWGVGFVHTVLVQTESVRGYFQEEFPNAQVKVAPFVKPEQPIQGLATQPIYDFLYVSSGDPHKNHQNLLQAWILLAKGGVTPTLALTLPPDYAELLADIEKATQDFKLKIINLSFVEHSKVAELYKKSRFLIYPSLCESFGLPLIEASQSGLAIVASERDYVWDVVVPVETFDPESPKSIQRSVLRVLGQAEIPQDFLSPAHFLNLLKS